MLHTFPGEDAGLRAARRHDDGIAFAADGVEFCPVHLAGGDKLHADAFDALELRLQKLMGKPSPGNDLLQLATDMLCIVVDRDLMPLAGKLPCRGKAADTAADDADLLARLFLGRVHLQEGTAIAKGTDLDGLVNGAAGTPVHTGIRADRAADRAREGRVLQLQLEGLFLLAIANEGIAPLGRYARGATELAGRRILRIVPAGDAQAIQPRGNGIVDDEIILRHIGENAALHPCLLAEFLYVRNIFSLSLRRLGSRSLFLEGQGAQFLPLAPIGKLCTKLRPPDLLKELLHASVQEGNILLVQIEAADIRGMGRDGAAHIDKASHHAHTGTLAEHRAEFLAVHAADHSAPAAHELEGEGAHILEHPKLRFLIERVMLHQGAGTGSRPSADEDLAPGGAMPRRVAGIAANRDDAAGIEPAHICRGRLIHQDLRVRQAHGAHALPCIRHMEEQLLPLRVPKGAADIMLARCSNLKIRLALPHCFLDGKQEVLRGHAFMPFHRIYLKHLVSPSAVSVNQSACFPVHQHTYCKPSLSATALSVDTRASLLPIGRELLPMGAMSFLSSESKAST